MIDTCINQGNILTFMNEVFTTFKVSAFVSKFYTNFKQI